MAAVGAGCRRVRARRSKTVSAYKATIAPNSQASRAGPRSYRTAIGTVDRA